MRLAPVFADALDDQTASLILGDVDPEADARRGELLVEARRVGRRKEAVPDVVGISLRESSRVADQSAEEGE